MHISFDILTLFFFFFSRVYETNLSNDGHHYFILQELHIVYQLTMADLSSTYNQFHNECRTMF